MLTYPSIESILESEGPCLSSRIAALLKQTGLSAAAARQRIARTKDPVRRLSGLPFPHGAQFLYHKDTSNSPRYWEALCRNIGEASPAYSAAIAALKARGGIVPMVYWDIISGSPIRQKRQMSSEVVLERLLAVDLVEVIDVSGIGRCIMLAADKYFGAPSREVFKARLTVEKILLRAVRDWARKVGAVSYNKVALRDDGNGLPQVGTFAWDLAGPSYLLPMVRWGGSGKPKPGFLVCDAISGQRVDAAAVLAFARKCELTANMKRMRPLLPIFITDGFSLEAFNAGRSRGLIVTTPDILFGSDVATGLATLLQTLTKTADIARTRPEVIGELFDKLGKIEGAAANLRGALFEVLVGHCTVKIDHGLIDIGKKIFDENTDECAEIDVFRVKEHQEVWSYECKAHQPGEIIGGEQVDKWLHERVPLIHRVLRCKERFQECTFHFEFWTCGSFSDESLEMLQGAAACTRKYKLGWRDGKDVRTYAARVRPKGIAEMLDQHFFAHPIARLDRAVPAGPTIIGDIDSSALIKGNAPLTVETPSLTLSSTVTGPLPL